MHLGAGGGHFGPSSTLKRSPTGDQPPASPSPVVRYFTEQDLGNTGGNVGINTGNSPCCAGADCPATFHYVGTAAYSFRYKVCGTRTGNIAASQCVSDCRPMNGGGILGWKTNGATITAANCYEYSSCVAVTCGCEVDRVKYCNFNNGVNGACELCSQHSLVSDCYKNGLSAQGAADCQARCFPGLGAFMGCWAGTRAAFMDMKGERELLIPPPKKNINSLFTRQ